MPARQLIIDGKKQCSKCLEWKLLNKFVTSSKTKSGFSGQCKTCKNKYQKFRVDSDPDYRKYRNKQNLRYFRKNKYGMSDLDFSNTLELQNNCCAICNIILDYSSTIQIPHIDHCHVSGQVRGILCTRCNTALGSFRDNIDYLMSAITYLKERN